MNGNSNGKSISRRDFLKNAGLMAGSATAFFLFSDMILAGAGCGNSDTETKKLKIGFSICYSGAQRKKDARWETANWIAWNT